MKRFAVIAFLLFLGPLTVQAQTELIKELPLYVYASNYALPAEYPELLALTFCLGYGYLWPQAGSLPLVEDVLEIQVGCKEAFPDGTTNVVRDYDASNTPDFEAFASRITDGEDQRLDRWLITLTTNDELASRQLNIFYGGLESNSDNLGGSPDLVCSRIDFVRLVINEVSVWGGTPDWGIFADVKFQIWGTNDCALHESVPVPVSYWAYLLMTVGTLLIGGFAFLARRKA
ncbi:MAG: hypothetical protein OEQ16_09075 [Gammaproteobacteria bacterium]|nr:hypothetical protein [Gammaproteobacteria bacterium]